MDKKPSTTSLALFEFLKAAIKDPMQVSTIFQTTPFAAHRLTRKITKSQNPFVIELGVGAGAVTEVIRHHLVNSSQYLGIEINPTLAEFMKTRYPDLEIHNDSAERLHHYLKGRTADLVVSTLPWTLLGPRVMERIVDQVYEALKEGGEFATYLAVNGLVLPQARSFLEYLDFRFGSHQEEWEILNIPPAKVIRVQKKTNE